MKCFQWLLGLGLGLDFKGTEQGTLGWWVVGVKHVQLNFEVKNKCSMKYGGEN